MRNILVIGLGNPGVRYAGTRHNLGFMVVDKAREDLGFPRWKSRTHSETTGGFIEGNELVLAKPQTYMNLSGEAISHLMRMFRKEKQDILVVVDDMSLPFGRIRFRTEGGDGGHNGLGSIIEVLGTSQFPRLRIGIGSPPDGMEGAEFVLSEFTLDEKKELPGILERAFNGVKTMVLQDLEMAMNHYNNVA
jgi:peptidyl-tRNA hydrolase, PTH1 family